MATLYLLRHLKSSWDVAGQADFDRTLAPRGRRAGRALARYLERARIRPDLILCSAAQRARSTLELVGGSWGGIDTCLERGLYEASDKVLMERLRTVPDSVGSVFLIGHNPGIERFALLLCDGRGDEQGLEQMEAKFPTGALAVLLHDAGSWAGLGKASCRLQTFIRPSDLDDR